MSLGEYKIYKILQKLDIEFTREFTFRNLKSNKGRHLRFDFGIQINDGNYLLIEFDEKHHFKHHFEHVLPTLRRPVRGLGCDNFLLLQQRRVSAPELARQQTQHEALRGRQHQNGFG